MANTFPKSEKLCGKQRIALLYAEGKRLVAFPMRVTYELLPESQEEPRVLIWAPKSIFKHAVQRNHMRRLMREAYRLNAAPLREYCHAHNCSIQLAFNYIDKELCSQEEISKAMQKAIRKILQKITN